MSKRIRRGALFATIIAVAVPLGVAQQASAAPPTFAEVEKFSPGDGVRAGYSVDLHGDYAAYTRVRSGAVDFAHHTGPASGDWTTSTVVAPVPGGEFGAAVAFNDDATRAYVAAPRESKIYVYARQGVNDWALETSLAPETQPSRVSSYRNSLGESLAVSGDTLVVGVPNARVDGKSNAGFAFAVDVSSPSPSWQPLLPEAPIANSITGQSVAVSGSHIAVSAVQNTDSNAARVGGVYLWNLTTETEPLFTAQPRNDGRMCIPSQGGGPAFGMSLDFAGDRLFVGSPIETHFTGDDAAAGCAPAAIASGQSTQGAVYQFDLDLKQLGGKIVPPAGTSNFGYSIAADGDTLIAHGAHAPDFAGEVQVFSIASLGTIGSGDENGRQAVEPVQTLTASDGAPGELFGQQLYGRGLQISGDRALVSAPNARDGAGSVYIFQPVGVVAPAEVTVSNQTIVYGQETSLLATITPGGVPLDGAVAAFSVAGIPVGEVPVTAGDISVPLAATSHEVGTAEISVQLRQQDGTSIDTVSTPGTLTVSPATTVTSVAVESLADSAGHRVSGAVTAQFGTAVTGEVVIAVDGTPIGSVPVSENRYSLEGLSIDRTRTAEVVATYSGDRNHIESSATEHLPTIAEPGEGTPGTIPPTTQEAPAATGALASTGQDEWALAWGALGILALIAGVGLVSYTTRAARSTAGTRR